MIITKMLNINNNLYLEKIKIFPCTTLAVCKRFGTTVLYGLGENTNFVCNPSLIQIFNLIYGVITMYLRQRMANDIKRNSKQRLHFAKLQAVARHLSV